MRPVQFFHLFLLVLLLVPVKSFAGVRVSMSEDIDRQAEVVVEAKITYSGLHGSHTKKLGSKLINSGNQVDFSVLAVLPLLYEKVYAIAFHPAYYIDSSSSKQSPSLLNRVTLPTLRPRSWAELMKTREPLREGGVGITAGAVNDHFYTILRYFLPAFDQAGGKENLRRHLPLLEQLAEFAHTPEALENSQQNMRKFSRHDPDKYIESVKKTEGQYRVQLTRRLKELKGWLNLEQDNRRPMHDWMKNLHKADYVFNQIMDESDRQQVYALLENNKQPPRPRKVQWQNPTTGINYGLMLTGRYKSERGMGVSTTLSTNLAPRIGLKKGKQYWKNSYPKFFENSQSGWQLIDK